MNYTILPQQLQCNECKQPQLATNKYCCNCGVKFIKGLDYDKEACKEAAEKLAQLTRYPSVCLGTSREVADMLARRMQGGKSSPLFEAIANELEAKAFGH